MILSHDHYDLSGASRAKGGLNWLAPVWVTSAAEETSQGGGVVVLSVYSREPSALLSPVQMVLSVGDARVLVAALQQAVGTLETVELPPIPERCSQ